MKVNLVNEYITELLTKEGISEYVAMIAKYHNQSEFNAAAIGLQKPKAAFVCDTSEWWKKGIDVLPNATSISLYVPRLEQSFMRNSKEMPIHKASTEETKNILKGVLAVKNSVAYEELLGYDISQTRCSPVHYDLFMKKGYENLQNSEKLECLKDFASDCGFELFRERLSSIAVKGYYDKDSDRIYVSNMLSVNQELSVFMSQLCRAIIEKTTPAKYSPEIKQFQADVLCELAHKRMDIPHLQAIDLAGSFEKAFEPGEFRAATSLIKSNKANDFLFKGIDITLKNHGHEQSQSINLNLKEDIGLNFMTGLE